MEYTYKRLKEVIKEKGYTIKLLAKVMNIHERTLRRKLCGERGFSQGEIIALCEALSISDNEVEIYFFDEKFK